MVTKPGPDSPWISPPSWFAAIRNGTPAVVARVASACTASDTDRSTVTPAVLRPYHTEPKCQAAIAAR